MPSLPLWLTTPPDKLLPSPPRYTGEWSKGKRHGHGVYTDSKGKVMSGSWKGDRLFEEDEQELTGTMVEPKDSVVSDGSLDGIDVGKIGLPL